MTVVAIIPARGGSKRIPRKNLREFNGKPMIQWTIEAAQESQIFDEIFVSTDDPEIAEFVKSVGLQVPFLRDAYFDDHSAVSKATINALNGLKSQANRSYDCVVQLMPNCPLRGAREIKSAWSNFIEKGFDFQISSFKFGWMNPWWAATVSKDGFPNPIFKGALSKRSQDLDRLYCPSGAIWIANVQKLVEQGSFYGKNFRFFEMNWKHAVDIDDFDDFEFAEIVAKSLIKNISRNI